MPEVTIAEAFAIADRRNPEVLLAEEHVLRAENAVSRAWSAFLPRVSAEAELRILDHDRVWNVAGERVVTQRQTNLLGTGTIEVPLVHLDSLSNLRNAQVEHESAELSSLDARRRVRIAVARVYYGILSAQRMHALEVRSRESLERHLRIARARHREGLGLALDATRAELELEDSSDRILLATALRTNLYDALALLLDRRDPVRVAEPPRPREPRDTDALVRNALARRADLRLVRMRRDATVRDVNAAWYAFAPSLDLAFHLTYAARPLPVAGRDTLNWNLMLVLSVPLYDHARYAELDERRSLAREAELRERVLRSNVSAEVRRAYRDWRTSATSADRAQRKVALAQAALELAHAAFRAGTASGLQVIDAERELREAEAGLVARSYASQLDLIELLLLSEHAMW